MIRDNNLLEINFEDNALAYPFYLRKNTSDIDVFREIIGENLYSIDFKLEPKVIIDCGANIGVSAVYLTNKYPESKIICIEPEINNYNLLLKNTFNYTNIICYNTGVWNCNDNLVIDDPGLGDWGFRVQKENNNTTHSFKALTINDIMKKHNIQNVDLLKVNIEGAEKELFESNYDYWIPKTFCMIIELHDHMKTGCSQSVLKALNEFDFSIKLKDNKCIYAYNRAAQFNDD